MILSSLGCVTGKSLILVPPKLDERFIKSFILGYFDGDGSFYVNTKEYFRAHLSIIGTREMMDWVSEYIQNANGVKFFFYKKKLSSSNTWSINLCGSKQVLRVMDWLYEVPVVSMERKHDYVVWKTLSTKNWGWLCCKEV